ncbi:MAG TPA: phosphatase PAP2 family protein [Ktedonobacteraceae bacterium]|nr:phosphatase PAP2 family protein [Ktedonobacteraceae bacterium]
MKYRRLLLGLSLCQLAGFGVLAWWAHKHPQDGTDIAITHIFQHKQSHMLRRLVLIWSTLTGDAMLLNLLTFPVTLILWLRQLWLEAIMTAITSWSTLLIRILVKHLVHRPRPSPLLIHVTDHKKSKSFPSGHVTSAMSLWGWLLGIGLIRRADLSTREKALLSIPALVIALTGPSRVYLGEHWASDVLGGYLLGGGWVGLCLRLYLLLRGQVWQRYE